METIYHCGGELDFAITLRDDKATRKSGRVFLDAFCRERGIPLLKVGSLNDPEAAKFIEDRGVNWLFIIGWSQIASAAVLGATRNGVLGIHPTLLPEGRGRAAIPWAIINGLERTGVTLFKLDEGVDTGPILGQEQIPISPDETAATLYEKVIAAHRVVITDVWPALEAGTVTLTPQDNARATYWPARTPADGELRPDMTVEMADRLIRATTQPYPGAFLRRGGQTIRIWCGRAVTGGPPESGVVRIGFADGEYDAVNVEIE